MNAAVDQRMSLDECAREPIHIPGAIQPHGFLIVIDAADERVLQVSANLPGFLGTPLEQLLGVCWRSLLDSESDPALATLRSEAPQHPPQSRLSFAEGVVTDGRTYGGNWHLYATRWLLEIQPIAASEERIDSIQARGLMRGVDDEPDIAAASTRMARGMRALFGYDRVMVYRFDREWNGEVIAEAAREDLEPYIGLHYPHTDIPAQARALYLRNRVRAIGDINYCPASLVPLLDPQTGEPTDLSDVALRSVSAVHVEYLSNMGVGATLVTSILVNARLWGLIACHHYSPRYPDHDARDVADLLTRSLGARIGSLERLQVLGHETRLLNMRERLLGHFSTSSAITPQQLREFSPELLEVVDADGVALLDDHVVSQHGIVPPDAVLMDIRRRIIESAGAGLHSDVGGVLYTDQLGAAFPDLAPIAGFAAGVLYIPLDSKSRSAILWTRVEQVRAVRWGGNPYLAKLQNYEGARLSPRQSFSSWQEVVSGRSIAWEPIHLESARSLRVLVELMDRKHYQSGFGVLQATLDSLMQPLFVLAVNAGSGHIPDIVYINPTFAQRTGLSQAADIIATWQLDEARISLQLGLQDAFRLFPRACRDRAGERREIELQPIGMQDGRRHWLGLLENPLPGA